MIVLGGSTDVTTYFALRLAADGTDATGLTITDIDLQYVRSGAAPSVKADATALAATDSAHGDNQAIEIDATDQPGLYRVDWPDAAFAAGAREVILSVKCATAFTEHLRVTIDPLVVANSITAGAITATAIADNAIDAASLAADAGAEIADAILNRDMSTGTDSGSTTVRTVRQALRFLRNKWAVSGGTLTVYKEDDATSSWTASVSTDAGAEPVIGSDPAGP